jgi:polyphosphate glucokinase
MEILGIDIGGSGIKAARVDVEKGVLVSDRYRLPMPEPSVPAAVADVVAKMVRHFHWTGPVGCTFPAIVKGGVALSAANVDKSWIGTDVQALLHNRTGCPVLVLNDADAAGIAEMEFGAGKGEKGLVILLTFGTGIGSAVFVNGVLVPNTELGHVQIRGKDAEQRAAARIRTEKKLGWKKWAKRVDEYLSHLEFLLSPDLFIIGGGVSKDHEKFLPLLHTPTRIVPAKLLNEAGIVGAALAAKALA